MGAIILTKHAESRMQQRGIRNNRLDLLLMHGEQSEAYDGATSILMSNKRTDQAIAILKREIQRLEGIRGVKAVIYKGRILTIYKANPRKHRNRRYADNLDKE